jgi:hypothetical protein
MYGTNDPIQATIKSMYVGTCMISIDAVQKKLKADLALT